MKGEVGGDKEGGRGEGFLGTPTKDTWTKPRGVESGEGGGDGWGGEGLVAHTCRQLYLNNNKIIFKKDCV